MNPVTQSAHAITSLTLENFRNYRSLSLTLPPAPVVLRGVNGAGKTNILEAISLLSPGRGLRGARLRETDRRVINPASPAAGEEARDSASSSLTTHDSALATSSPWVVAANVVARGERHFIGTGRDGEAASEKRLIKIDGEKVKSHATLTHHACIQWLTPSMDQVFIEGGSARRKFFDRLVYGFEPEHAARVSAYEAAMRERNRLLSDRARADAHWLRVLEQQMAQRRNISIRTFSPTPPFRKKPSSSMLASLRSSRTWRIGGRLGRRRCAMRGRLERACFRRR